MDSEATFFQMTGITKSYWMGDEWSPVLRGIDLTIQEGEFLSVLGPSGSGKSTLMNIIGCLDTADSGSYMLNDKPIQKYRERQLPVSATGRSASFFRDSTSCPSSPRSKTSTAPVYQGVGVSQRRAAAREALERVGLGQRMKHRPAQLSGGQQQRCAIARAIAVKPSLILADEPTGNLDKKTGREILQIFRELHQAGNTIVLITHDPKVAQSAERVIRIEDGQLYENQEVPQDVLPVV